MKNMVFETSTVPAIKAVGELVLFESILID